ncbi:hypothetical protein BV20DRAFT_1058160 [Pilatotrama ljubarskyi]|nr:hypothetical protein BV20DRAFT_1058160 [Pilatotrama ljubarskyi]
MDSGPNAALPISRLNEDVFHHLAEQLQYELSLRAFSRTCKDVRQRCMPVLFRACVAQPLTNIKSYFLPEVLWPYVRSLTFIDPCAMISAPNRLPQWSDEPPPHTVQVGVGEEDPLLCRIYDETTLRAALWNMPQLHTLVLKGMSASMAHGRPWSVLQVVLSVPHLREFTCERYFISTRPLSSGLHGLSLAGHAPLECFRYVSWDYRQPPKDFPAEKDALNIVLNTLHESLRTPELPAESSTIDTMASLTWPSLRTLTLRGYPPQLDSTPAGSEPQVSYISALSTMPKLRVLELFFSYYPREPNGARASLTSVWPPQCIATYPWPDLERLTLSYPRADDRLYTHLPATLRSLSLRYVPHLVTAAWAADTDQYRPPWQEPPLLARGLLAILRQCGTPMLEELEVEYHRTERDPEAEGALLQYIGDAFPRLTSLKILRYHAERRREVDVESIARAVGRLARLRTVSLHLDLPETPSKRYFGRLGGSFNLREEDQLVFRAAVQRAADILARHLGSGVEHLKMLRPYSVVSHEWAVYRLVRRDSDPGSGHGSSVTARAEYDHKLTVRGILRCPPLFALRSCLADTLVSFLACRAHLFGALFRLQHPEDRFAIPIKPSPPLLSPGVQHFLPIRHVSR